MFLDKTTELANELPDLQSGELPDRLTRSRSIGFPKMFQQSGPASNVSFRTDILFSFRIGRRVHVSSTVDGQAGPRDEFVVDKEFYRMSNHFRTVCSLQQRRIDQFLLLGVGCIRGKHDRARMNAIHTNVGITMSQLKREDSCQRRNAAFGQISQAWI